MKKNSKELKIGIAFVVAIFVIYFGISYLKGINIFKSSNNYLVSFNNVMGLTRSAPITLHGYQIGLVKSIELDKQDADKILVHVEMKKGIRIPKGSKMYLMVSVLGTSSIDMQYNSTSREFYNTTDTIMGIKNKGMMDAAGNMLPQVALLLPKLDSILTGVNVVLKNPALEQSVTNVGYITGDLAKTTKKLDVMITYLNKTLPTILSNVDTTSRNLTTLTTNFNKVDLKAVDASIKNIENLTNQLNSKNNSVGALMNSKEIYDSISKTISNASALLKDLKENPKRYVTIKVF